MTEEQINELERLAAQATPGPWRVKCDNEICAGEKKVHLARVMLSYKEWEANAAYIVAACNSVRPLVERVRELEAENERLSEENHTLYSRWETCLQDYRRLENKAAKEAIQ